MNSNKAARPCAGGNQPQTVASRFDPYLLAVILLSVVMCRQRSPPVGLMLTESGLSELGIFAQSARHTIGGIWPLRAIFFVLLNADEPGTPLFGFGAYPDDISLERGLLRIGRLALPLRGRRLRSARSPLLPSPRATLTSSASRVCRPSSPTWTNGYPTTSDTRSVTTFPTAARERAEV